MLAIRRTLATIAPQKVFDLRRSFVALLEVFCAAGSRRIALRSVRCSAVEGQNPQRCCDAILNLGRHV